MVLVECEIGLCGRSPKNQNVRTFPCVDAVLEQMPGHRLNDDAGAWPLQLWAWKVRTNSEVYQAGRSSKSSTAA